MPFLAELSAEILHTLVMDYLPEQEIVCVGLTCTLFLDILNQYKKKKVEFGVEGLKLAGKVLCEVVERPVDIQFFDPLASGIIQATPYAVEYMKYKRNPAGKQGLAVFGDFKDSEGNYIFLNILPHLVLDKMISKRGTYRVYRIVGDNVQQPETVFAYDNLEALFRSFREHLDIEADKVEAKRDTELYNEGLIEDQEDRFNRPW